MGKIVGIDLGTTNSVVAVMEAGKPVVITNSEGSRTTPSVISFSKDSDRLVGQMARRQSVLNPENTFYSIKRFIGRKHSELNSDAKRVPYTVRRDEIGNIKIKSPRLEKDFAPEELSAMIIRKLVDEASRYLGAPVTGAVITVPNAKPPKMQVKSLELKSSGLLTNQRLPLWHTDLIAMTTRKFWYLIWAAAPLMFRF
jgi:molecular chaperone DnaK